MSTVTAGPVTAPQPLSAARRARSWLLIGGAVVVAIVVAAWLGRGNEEFAGRLDPGNSSGDGGQAVAEVLRDQGVDVSVVRSADALVDADVTARTTVVVSDSELLAPSRLSELRAHAAAGRLVFLEPSYSVVQEVDPDQQTLPVFDSSARADCPGDVAGAALDGLRVEADQVTGYTVPAGARSCFAVDGGALLVDDPAHDVVYFGAGDALTNDQVLRADNAAVALRLLGTGDRVVWYVPDPADAEAGDAVTLSALLPEWVQPGLALLALAVIALMAWRFRRLGPLATEPLPVVVRAVETTRSRGRMYRKSGDRGHAADTLRQAARRAWIKRLRLDRRATPDQVADAVARHLELPVEAVRPLLASTEPPASDRGLIQLSDDLARLTTPVRPNPDEVRR